MSEFRMPGLSFGPGTSGLEIRAKLAFEADCKEFVMKRDYPQPVFISPWIQFEDPRLVEERTSIAMEIIRRVVAHDSLLKEATRLAAQEKYWRDAYYDLQDSKAVGASGEVKNNG